MIRIINKFIEKEQLFGVDSKILLAVSGGVDSMCLLDVLHKLKYNIGVAHLNHQLRSADSDEDETFVIDRCQSYGVTCHSKQVDIQSIATQHKRNISDVGREERYHYFSTLCSTFGYTHIATAHHADDDIETFLMRSMDGSGLKGLASIPIKNQNIVRPLLNISRLDIEDYAKEQQLPFREDASNDSLKYLRNAIRKVVIPEIETIKASSKDGIKQSINILKDSNHLLTTLIQKEINVRTQKEKNRDVIDISKLEKDGKLTFIYHLIKPYGFNRSQAIDILEVSTSGKYFHSQSHTILLDREQLIISPLENTSSDRLELSIPSFGSYSIGENAILDIEQVDAAVFTSDSSTEFIDADYVSFPLRIRRWKDGDTFKPIGMNGQSQSLQDFFTNQKISRLDKQDVWILESNKEIIWILGYRISDTCKVSKETKHTLRMRFIQQ